MADYFQCLSTFDISHKDINYLQNFLSEKSELREQQQQTTTGNCMWSKSCQAAAVTQELATRSILQKGH
jgi:hypothetical protein